MGTELQNLVEMNDYHSVSFRRIKELEAALASITRERDALKAEADETNGLLEEMRRQLTIAQDERDAMREASARLNREVDRFWNDDRNDDQVKRICHAQQALAALVNGEGE